MKKEPFPSGCACCPMHRRNFLIQGSAIAAGALGCLTHPAVFDAAEPKGKTRIRIVYSLHTEKQDRPDWPNKGFDFVPVMERINSTLSKKCKGFEFLASQASGPEQAKKILEEDQSHGIDGYVVYQLNCWNQVVQTIATSGKPVLYADFQFGGSGGFLVYTAGFLRNKTPNVGFVASSRIDDLVEAMNCFQLAKKGQSVSDFVRATEQVRLKQTPQADRQHTETDQLQCLSTAECLRRLKETKILAVKSQESGPAGEMMGIPIVQVSFAEVNEAWKKADREQIRQVADQWEKNAASITGVTRETLETSAAMYLAQKAVMKKYDAGAITINCLGGFYGGHIQAYPCLGFHQLNSDGLVGACECDVRSTATMLSMTTLTQGRSGYISDPVIDTAKRQIIYAHCVAPNKVFGPQGKTNPFHIMTHSEDRQGASVRSILPVGYLTTTLEIHQDRKEILFHQAQAVANDPDDRACRTKLCGSPLGDIEKLFTQWDQWGWHRVTFYGNLKEPVQAFADAIGWKVVEEA
jgi:hypothetical protein